MTEQTEPGVTRLADLLVAAGLDRTVVEAARTAARDEGEPFVTVVLRRGLMDARSLASLVARATAVAIHHIEEAPAALPSALARRVRAHVLGWVTINGERRLLVGMVDPTDVVSRLDVMRALGGPVHTVVIADDELSRVLHEQDPFEQLTTGAALALPSWDPNATLPRADLMARIANTLVERAATLGPSETQPTVRTRLLRALASFSPAASAPPLAILRELRLLVVAHDPLLRAQAARELVGVSKFRAALSLPAALLAVREATFDGVVLLGPLPPNDDAADLDALAERAVVVAVAVHGAQTAKGVSAVVHGPIAEGDLAAAIVRGLMKATGDAER